MSFSPIRTSVLSQVACLAVLVAAQPAHAVMTSLAPDRDNSMYEEAENSNGVGTHLFSGETNFNAARRALLRFNIAGAIPAGSTINSVSLRLTCTAHPFLVNNFQPFGLHRLTANWGEGTTNAGDPGGTGLPATSGDATWNQRFFAMTSPWATAGGDFSATTSGSAMVGQCLSPTAVNFPSTAQMVADVQGWLGNPASNFGWILIGNETALKTARRFESREAASAAVRPRLTVDYTPPAATPGAVPDGDDVPGVPLKLDKAPGSQILLDWSASCQPDDNYGVYEGQIGSYYSHAPVTCSTVGATTYTMTPSFDAAYYVVVPQKGSLEGSYGTDSDGDERPQLGGACLTQSLGSPVCP